MATRNLRQSGNVKRSPPLLPPVDRLEEALRELIDQVFDHRRQWVKRNAAPHQLAIEMALRSQITAVGWHLAEQLTFGELQQLVERVACVANDEVGESERRFIVIERCLDGLRTATVVFGSLSGKKEPVRVSPDGPVSPDNPWEIIRWPT